MFILYFVHKSKKRCNFVCKNSFDEWKEVRKSKGGKTKCGKGWMRLECSESLVNKGVERC